MSRFYRASHYQHIHEVEAEHFWFVGRDEMIRGLIGRYVQNPQGKTFLDIGCGTGVTLEYLEQLKFVATGLDINARALSYAKRRTDSTLVRSTIFQYHPKRPFAALGAFDVMEHIGDDAAFLRQCKNLLISGGLLFLTVPAEKYLWSSVDVLSGHKRRYTKDGLRELFAESGLRVRHMGYWNSILLPAYIMWRLMAGKGREDLIMQYLTMPNPLFNRILLTILRADTIIFRGHLPFGASLVVVAEKV